MAIRVLILILPCLFALDVRAQHSTVQTTSGSTATVRLGDGITVEPGTVRLSPIATSIATSTTGRGGAGSAGRDRTRRTSVVPFRKCSAQSVPLPSSEVKSDSSILRITSFPDSATVRINDEVRGVTPLDLRVGPRTIAVQLERGDQLSEPDSLVIAPGTWRHENYDFSPLPAARRAGRGRAALVVSSTPVRAEIFIDGERKGITPRRFELDPGPVVLKIGTSKYRAQEDSLVLRSGEGRTEHYCLQEKLAPLDVRVYPWGASVYVDGRPAGETPLSTGVPFGKKTIRVERQGYVPFVDTVFAWGGAIPEDIEATMQPEAGWLRVRSNPSGAEVRLDNVLVGATPLDLRVPQGEYDVAVFDGGTTLFEEQVLVSAGGDETVRVQRSDFIAEDTPSAGGSTRGPLASTEATLGEEDGSASVVDQDPAQLPDIRVDVSFTEPSGNEALEAGETGRLDIRLHNRGKGEARTVIPRVVAEFEIPGMELGAAGTLASLAPGEIATVSIPVVATAGVRTTTAYARVEILDSRSAAPATTVSISFETVSAFDAEQRRAACGPALSEAESSAYDNRFDDAVQILERCIDGRGFDADEKMQAYMLLARIHLRQDSVEAAEASLRKLIAMAPDYRPDPVMVPKDLADRVEKVRDDMAREAAMTPVEKAVPMGLEDISLPANTPHDDPASID